MNKSQKDIIVKHNDLVESSYYLTYNQQKIMLYLISKIDNFNTEKDLFETFLTIDITFPEILEILGKDPVPASKSKRHTYIIDILRSLKNKNIEIKTEDKIRYTSWVLVVEYHKYNSNIKVYLDPELKDMLLFIKEKFTQYNLSDVIKFQYTHSFRIYELVKQYQSIGKRIIPLDEFKKYLGIPGKYPRYNQFKERVLNPSIEDINSFSDLSVQYTTQRKNKVPQTITFIMELKNKQIEHTPSKLKSLGIPQDKQEEIVNRYKGFEKIMDGKIEFILNRKDIKHLPAYAYKCLMDEPLPAIKDIPVLTVGMKIKSLKTEKVFSITEGFVIRDEKNNIIASEGMILDGILQKRFIIV